MFRSIITVITVSIPSGALSSEEVDMFDFHEIIQNVASAGASIWEGSDEIATCPVTPYSDFSFDGPHMIFNDPRRGKVVLRLLDDGHFIWGEPNNPKTVVMRFILNQEESDKTRFVFETAEYCMHTSLNEPLVGCNGVPKDENFKQIFVLRDPC